MSNQPTTPSPFDEWFEDSHRCDIDGGYCHAHDSSALEGDRLCQYALGDPLQDPHDIAVEDAMIDEATYGDWNEG